MGCCESNTNEASCGSTVQKIESPIQGIEAVVLVDGFEPGNKIPRYVTGTVSTAAGIVPRVSTELLLGDTLGTWKARWGIGRMNYTVKPGVYAVGTPDQNSPVLVTANYKMTFDRLRRELTGIDAWIQKSQRAENLGQFSRI